MNTYGPLTLPVSQELLSVQLQPSGSSGSAVGIILTKKRISRSVGLFPFFQHRHTHTHSISDQSISLLLHCPCSVCLSVCLCALFIVVIIIPKVSSCVSNRATCACFRAREHMGMQNKGVAVRCVWKRFRPCLSMHAWVRCVLADLLLPRPWERGQSDWIDSLFPNTSVWPAASHTFQYIQTDFQKQELKGIGVVKTWHSQKRAAGPWDYPETSHMT